MQLKINNYDAIGIIAKHCDLSKLKIAENEACNFDLSELFCDFWADIEEIYKEICEYDNLEEPKPPIPENYELKKQLLEGGNYLDCKGKNREFVGIYTILAYYSYSRYVIINRFSDTPNGMTGKTNDFSIPTPLKELEDFADKYRNMGKISFERINRFICKNKDIFDYEICKINSCGCNYENCGKNNINTKGFGLLSRNIRK